MRGSIVVRTLLLAVLSLAVLLLSGQAIQTPTAVAAIVAPLEPKIAFYRFLEPANTVELWTMNADGTNELRIVDPASEGLTAAVSGMWSPDGSKIAYEALISTSLDKGEVRIRNSDGSGTYTTIWAGDRFVGGPDWSPDGTAIAHNCSDFTICITGLDGVQQWVFHSQHPLSGVQWSPDGRFLLYQPSLGPLNSRVWAIRISDKEIFELTSTYSYTSRWNQDGTKIAFGSNLDALVVMDVLDDGAGGLTTGPETPVTIVPTNSRPVGFLNDETLILWNDSGKKTYSVNYVAESGLAEIGTPIGNQVSSDLFVPSQVTIAAHSTGSGGSPTIHFFDEFGSDKGSITHPSQSIHHPEISNSGNSVVYTAGFNPWTIEVAPIDGSSAGIPIATGTRSGATNASWSPDDTQIVHPCSGLLSLCITQADGSSSRVIFDGTSVGTDAAITKVRWSPTAETILITEAISASNFRMFIIPVPPEGETAVAPAPLLDTRVSQIAWSQDGSQILFFSQGSTPYPQGLWVINSDGTNPVHIQGELPTAPNYRPAGFISSARVVGSIDSTGAFAIDTDGQNFQWIDTGRQDFTTDVHVPTFTTPEPLPVGTKLPVQRYSSDSPASTGIVVLEESGIETQITAPNSVTFAGRISPDGNKIAYNINGDPSPTGSTGITDIADPSQTITIPGGAIVGWAPDSDTIAHTCDALGNVCLSDSSGTLLNSSFAVLPVHIRHLDWSPDGTKLLASEGGGSQKTYLIPVTGEPSIAVAGTPQLLIENSLYAVWNADSTEILSGRGINNLGSLSLHSPTGALNGFIDLNETPPGGGNWYYPAGFLSDERIVFSNSETREVFAINVDGSGRSRLGSGAPEIAWDVWVPQASVPPTIPQIADVSPIMPNPDPLIRIEGSGFGDSFPSLRSRGTSAFLRVQNLTAWPQADPPGWSAGFTGDVCEATVLDWADDSISVRLHVNSLETLTLCPLNSGDELAFSVWNTDTGAALTTPFTVFVAQGAAPPHVVKVSPSSSTLR